MILRLLILAVALGWAPAFAADCTVANSEAVKTSIGALGTVYTLADGDAVVSTGTFASDCLNLSRASTFGITGSCSGSAPDVQVDWQESAIQDTTGFATTTAIEANVTTTLAIEAFSPPPMLYGRLLLTGVGSNGADTTCTFHVYVKGDQ